jgi:II/X family phage/plasmid replication protein
MTNETFDFDKESERWAIKLYSASEQIKTKIGALPLQLKNIGSESWAQNKLRIELKLHSKELVKLDIINAMHLLPEHAVKLFNDYLAKINMTDQIKLPTETANNLPNRLKSTYTLWSEGHDLISVMSKATYYRQRKLLIDNGINIDIQACEVSTSNVIPMLRVVEAVPASIPEWAFAKNVIHHSANSK